MLYREKSGITVFKYTELMDNGTNIIAVVTPVFNGEKTIEKTIKSLLNQTFKNWVNIIINDGSNDCTREILNKYSDDSRFLIINLDKNIGRGGARKLALEHVKQLDSKYMCMLDADDLYYENKLDWQFKFMESNPTITLMSSSIGYIDDSTKLNGVLEVYTSNKIIEVKSFKDYVAVPHASSIIRVSEIGDVTFDEKFHLGQDQDFMIRLLIGKKYAFVPKIGYLYNRIDSFSLNKYKKSLYYSRKSQEKFNLNLFDKIKIIVQNSFKIFYIWFLTILGKQNIYFKRLGREPRKVELKEHLDLLCLS